MTSSAAPQVSGTAALILSTNPNLTQWEVRSILRNTADKVGGYNYNWDPERPGLSKELGYGRIDCYQALLLTLTYSNQSHSSLATANNNGRRLVKDGNNRYHLVFESGGEIFYRRSNIGGTSWETPVRLSTGNGNNKFPSITGTSTKQFAVWQRYTGYSGGQHKYDTYFAKNTGSGWTKYPIANLSNLGFYTPTDPLPVLTYKTISGGYRFLACARTNSGIRFLTSDNEGGTWSSANNVPSTTLTSNNPSLSMGPNTPSSIVYLTYDDEGEVYFNTHNTSWGSVENVSNSSGCAENKNASVEVGGYSVKNVAWEGRKLSNNKYVIVHRRKIGSWEAVKYFEPASGNGYHRPSITGHYALKSCSIVWHDELGTVHRAYTNDGSNWSFTVWEDGWVQNPNLSAGTTTAKYVFTIGSASPYSIYLSTETLPPGGLAKTMLASTPAEEDHLKMLPCPQRYHRAAVVEDTTSSSLLWVQWGEITAKTQTGGEIPFRFIAWEDSLSKVTQETVFDYLSTEPLVLPENVDSLKWEQELYGCELQRLVSKGRSNAVVEVQLVAAKSGSPLAVLHRAALSAGSSESRVAGKVITDISAYRGQEVILTVHVLELDPIATSAISNIGEVFIIENPLLEMSQPKAQPSITAEPPLPLNYKLEPSYPNPFNPETNIAYALPQAGHVRIEVYNVLGQKIVTLVDAEMPAGNQSVRWNGRNALGEKVSAGIYLCRMQAGEFTRTQKMTLLP